MGAAGSKVDASEGPAPPSSPLSMYSTDPADGYDQTDDELEAQEVINEIWREYLERLLARPTNTEFPWLSSAQEAALKRRGRHRSAGHDDEHSSLPRHHDRARRELRARMRTIIGRLKWWSNYHVSLLDHHIDWQTQNVTIDCDHIRNMSFWWLSTDKTCQEMLQVADKERARCFEFLGRPGVAKALKPEILWAEFPGCPPNRVQIVKRSRLHYRNRQYMDLRRLELEMEGAAALVKAGAKDLYAAQCAFYTAISEAKPDFWFVENPPSLMVSFSSQAEWGNR